MSTYNRLEKTTQLLKADPAKTGYNVYRFLTLIFNRENNIQINFQPDFILFVLPSINYYHMIAIQKDGRA